MQAMYPTNSHTHFHALNASVHTKSNLTPPPSHPPPPHTHTHTHTHSTLLDAEDPDLDSLLADLCQLEEDTKAQLASATNAVESDKPSAQPPLRYVSELCNKIILLGNLYH